MIGVLLAGCRPAADAPREDRTIMWDSDGCAYSVEHQVADSFFVHRLPDVDISTDCKRK
jgi:hypothetical protein